jgi:release factor glutamine methyltransferase
VTDPVEKSGDEPGEEQPTPVRDLLREAARRLSEGGVASPEYDAAELLAHVLGTTRGQLPLADPVPAAGRETYDGLVGRRATREPLQHLIGTAAFRHVELLVGSGVFVPRPETELVAGWAIDRTREAGRDSVRATGEQPVVVDLCTGSGAIALSISDEVPDARVHAVELDPSAFQWAERNLAGSGVDLRLGDMADAFPDLDGTVDVVVCNPPYIPLEAFESVAPEARDHDPALALWSGDDGLDAIRILEATAARLLRPGGWVGVEHADVQGESTTRVFLDAGRWTDVRDHEDLAGRSRYVVARLAR